jgi:hypothetical protein|tara:strand:+ start:177 stop:470 length:294 start_codon:yes stop_codon:yes gene_type:complete
MNKYKLLFVVTLCFGWWIDDDITEIHKEFEHNMAQYLIQQANSPADKSFSIHRESYDIINDYIVLDSLYMEMWLDYQNLYWLHYKTISPEYFKSKEN